MKLHYKRMDKNLKKSAELKRFLENLRNQKTIFLFIKGKLNLFEMNLICNFMNC